MWSLYPCHRQSLSIIHVWSTMAIVVIFVLRIALPRRPVCVRRRWFLPITKTPHAWKRLTVNSGTIKIDRRKRISAPNAQFLFFTLDAVQGNASQHRDNATISTIVQTHRTNAIVVYPKQLKLIVIGMSLNVSTANNAFQLRCGVTNSMTAAISRMRRIVGDTIPQPSAIKISFRVRMVNVST